MKIINFTFQGMDLTFRSITDDFTFTQLLNWLGRNTPMYGDELVKYATDMYATVYDVQTIDFNVDGENVTPSPPPTTLIFDEKKTIGLLLADGYKKNTAKTYISETKRLLKLMNVTNDLLFIPSSIEIRKAVDILHISKRSSVLNSLVTVCRMNKHPRLSELTTLYKQVRYENADKALLQKNKLPTKKKDVRPFKYYESITNKLIASKDGSRKHALNALIATIFTKNKMVPRRDEVRCMKMINDGESNYIDLTNRKMIISQHKNSSQKKGYQTRVIELTDEVYNEIVNFHQLFPSSYLIPKNATAPYGKNGFTDKVKRLLGVLPSNLRTSFDSFVTPTLSDDEIIKVNKANGHSELTRQTHYQFPTNEFNPN